MPARPRLHLAVLLFCAAIAPSALAATPGNPCSCLTQAQVAAALGTPVSAGTPSASGPKACTWTANNHEASVSLTLLDLAAFQTARTSLVPNKNVTTTRGIGDDAFYSAIGAQVDLFVKKGKAAFKLTDLAAKASVLQKVTAEEPLALKAASAM